MLLTKDIKDYMFNAIKEAAVNNGFKRNDESQGGGVIKKNENTLFEFGYGIGDYYEIKKMGGGFGMYIRYIEVEKIVNPILVRNHLFGGNENDIPVTFIPKKYPFIENINAKKIEDLIPIAQFYVNSFIESALPFFDCWKDLKTVDNYFENTPIEESEYSIGRLYQFKLAAIKRLCGNPNYQSYMDEYYELQEKYYKEDPKDVDNINYYNAAKELKELLDKTAPVYK